MLRRTCLCILVAVAGLISADAASPSWWVLSGTANNYAPANLGQLKYIAKQAKSHLDSNVVGGAGTGISTLVGSFEPRTGQGYTQPEIDAFLAENYAPINLGQLKYVAKPFYDRLLAAGYDTKANLIARGLTGWTHDYPWDPETPPEENYAPANLGQLKLVFSFDLASFDTDQDGLPDQWEVQYFDDIWWTDDPDEDLDGDGLTNFEESVLGSDPANYYDQGQGEIIPSVEIISGNNQTGPPGMYLEEPLAVQVRNSETGEVLANAPVAYDVTHGDIGLALAKGLVSTDITQQKLTDENGIVRIYGRPDNAALAMVQVQANSTLVRFTINNSGAIPGAGLQVWLKADEGVVTQGSEVVSWEDRSGNARNAQQTNVAARPAWQAGALNGKASVKFDGVDDFLAGALGYNGSAGDLTIIAVHRRPGAAYWGAPVSLSASQYGTPILGWRGASWELGINNVGVNDTGVYVNSGSDSRGRYLLSSVSRAGGYSGNGNGGALSVRSYDGETQLTASGTQTWNSNSSTNYHLGRHWANDPATHLKGEVVEVLIYNRVLTEDERNEIESYLKDKYELGDFDEDGIQDGWENQYGLWMRNPDDAAEDLDGDGLTNLQEFQQGSDPTDYYDGVTWDLTINDGNNQIGSGYLTDPLEVKVSGTGGVGLENKEVTFRVTAGPGEIATENPGTPEDEIIQSTDEDGLAKVYLNVTGTAVVTVQAQVGTKTVQFVANTPTSGLKLWLRADAGVTANAGGRVSQWIDQSGNGMTALNTNASAQPLLVAEGLNQKPVLRFDGVDDQLSGTSTYNASAGDYTILTIHRRSAVSSWSAPFSFSVNPTANGAPLMTWKESGSEFGVNNAGVTNVGVYVNTGTTGLNRFSLASATRSGGTSGNGGTLNLKMDAGLTSALTATGTQTWTSGTTSGYYLARHNGGGPTQLKGDIAEVIVYDRVLTTGELTQMEGYLKTKYALTDADNDGLADWWEVQYGLSPATNADAALDADGDGLTNLQEFQQNTDPTDYYSRTTPVTSALTIDSGNNQTGRISQFLPKPLVAKVVTGTTPLANAPVTFKVTEGGGVLAASPGPTTASTLTVQSGSNGLAKIYYRQGSEKGSNTIITATTGTSTVTFQATTSEEEDALVGQWRFDEGTGKSIADSSGFVQTGTLGNNGPAFVAGLNDETALSFSGTGSDNAYIVSSGSTTRLNFDDGSFSLSFWMKTPSTTYGRLICNGAWYSVKGYAVDLTSNISGQYGRLSLHLSSSGTSAADLHVVTQNTVNDNQWHHIAAVVDREKGKALLYIDGVSQEFDPAVSTGTGLVLASGTPGAGINAMPTLRAVAGEALRFGQFQTGGNPYKGLLDEVRIYNKALTEDEVEDLYNQDAELQAVEQSVTVDEDTLGTVTLTHQGGGDLATATYEIVDEPTNGTATLDGNIITYLSETNYNGSDTLRFRVTKNGHTSEADVNITVAPVNDLPSVFVGGNRSVTLPDALNLSATVVDIDTDPEDISLNWVKISGPGSVTFSEPSALSTAVTFGQAGEYVLRLIANDGWGMRSASLNVTVNEEESEDLPEVTLTEPPDEEVYTLPATILLKATASASGGRSVNKVEFFEGSRKIGEATTPASGTYNLSWSPPFAATFTLSARVTDSVNFKASSSSKQVTVVGGGGGGPGPGPQPTPPPDGDEDDPEKDTDGDGVLDREDAVPNNPAMKAPAAPEANYAVIDLGAPGKDVRGVNDHGDVLLTQTVSPDANGNSTQGYLWKNGTLKSIGKGQGFMGVLNDGTVYYGVAQAPTYANQLEIEKTLRYSWNDGRTGRAGVMDESATVYQSREFSELPSPTMIAAAIIGEAQAKSAQAVSVSGSDNFGDPIVSYSGYTFSVNDNHEFSVKMGLGISSVDSGRHCGGWAQGWGSVIAASGWETDMNVSGWQGGGYLGGSARVNTEGIAISSKRAVSEAGDQPTVGMIYNGSWSEVGVAESIIDINISDSPEGPYFIYRSSGWAYFLSCFGGGFPSVPLNTSVPLFGGVSSRQISKNLVIPAGANIWRNGKLINLKKLCPDGWSGFDINLVSQNTNILVGKASKDGGERPISLIPVDLAVDANRDGTIKFAGNLNDPAVAGKPRDMTEKSRPFRFWINNDHDVSDTNADGEDLSGVADSADDVIKTRRDLEDFTRLHIYLGGLQEAIGRGDIRVGLKWKNATGPVAIKIYTSADAEGSDEYLHDEDSAVAQFQGDHGFAQREIKNGGKEFIFFNDVWTGLSDSNPRKYFIFEGSGEGKGELVVTFYKSDGTPIGEGGSVWIDLKDIRRMYTRAEAVGNIPHPPSFVYPSLPPEPTMSSSPKDEGQTFDSSPTSWAEGKQYIVFVHGWNMTYEGSKNYAETMFKRLWQKGYKGRFVFFRWPTLVGRIGTYNDSEFKAWKCGESLKEFVNGLDGNYTRNVVAHSMGNIVAGSALKKGMSIANYNLMNAAVPAMCYDTSPALHQTGLSWKTPTPDGDADAGTRALGYGGQLQGVSGKLTNFYLTQDFATTTAWEANNWLSKPQSYSATVYFYDPALASGKKLFYTVPGATHRDITDIHEAMAYVDVSRTKTAGADDRALGSIQVRINMDDFGFATNHSAQFNLKIQSTSDCYNALLSSFGILPNP